MPGFCRPVHPHYVGSRGFRQGPASQVSCDLGHGRRVRLTVLAVHSRVREQGQSPAPTCPPPISLSVSLSGSVAAGWSGVSRECRSVAIRYRLPCTFSLGGTRQYPPSGRVRAPPLHAPPAQPHPALVHAWGHGVGPTGKSRKGIWFGREAPEPAAPTVFGVESRVASVRAVSSVGEGGSALPALRWAGSVILWES